MTGILRQTLIEALEVLTCHATPKGNVLCAHSSDSSHRR
jgi:hypothetical protein